MHAVEAVVNINPLRGDAGHILNTIKVNICLLSQIVCTPW